MRIRGAVLLVALFAGSVGAPSAARAVGGGAPDATLGPLVSGTGHYVDGTYVWTDYAYDDKLASYGQHENNSADLIQLQLSEVTDGVLVRAVFETVTAASKPVLFLSVDTNLDSTKEDSAHVERVITLASDRARVTAGDDLIDDVPSHLDPASNTLEATIPFADFPSLDVWRVYGGTSPGPGAPPVDLAFVGGEAPSGWQTARQTQMLAAGLPADGASATLDFDAMRAGATTAADDSPGFHTFLYHSNLNLAEGIQAWNLAGPGGAQLPLGNFYAGPYQPYVVWVPDRALPEHPPLVVYMHGLQGTHTSNAGTLGTGAIDPDAVVVMPLGRGEDSFYEREGEQDILDVTDDAMARFDIDPDRVVLSGISMGGFGAFRLGILRPDRWSAIVPLIGTSNSAQFYFGPAASPSVFSPGGFPSGAGELMENLTNVPVRMVNGQVDPIVNNAFVNADTAAMMRFGIDFRSWVLLRRQHEVVPAITDCVFDEAVARKRADPARVVFSTEPATYERDDATGLDLNYRRAYWVSGVTARDASAIAKVDASNLRRADRVTSSGQIVGPGENLRAPLDLCGNHRTQTQDAWRQFGNERTAGRPQPVSNGLELLLANVGALDVDLARAHLDTTSPVTINAYGDGTTTLVLHGAWPGPVKIARDGVPFTTVAPHDGTVTFTDDMTTLQARADPAAIFFKAFTYIIAPA